MSWKSRLPRSDTGPERAVDRILDEMQLKYERNQWIDTPFRDYPVEADKIVEGCLIIEIQSRTFHTKKRRVRKDRAKRNCFEAMGFGYLELWDDEIRRAEQVKAGKIWRPALKEWIRLALENAKLQRILWLQYIAQSRRTIMVSHPEYGELPLSKRRRARSRFPWPPPTAASYKESSPATSTGGPCWRG